ESKNRSMDKSRFRHPNTDLAQARSRGSDGGFLPGPACAFEQRVTVSLWRETVVLPHSMCGVKGLTFLHQYCRNMRSLPVFFHTEALVVLLYALGVVSTPRLALAYTTT